LNSAFAANNRKSNDILNNQFSTRFSRFSTTASGSVVHPNIKIDDLIFSTPTNGQSENVFNTQTMLRHQLWLTQKYLLGK
jgi:hypothetical protein